MADCTDTDDDQDTGEAPGRARELGLSVAEELFELGARDLLAEAGRER